MTKIALLFPGQGAQYAGMGKELADNYPVAMEIFDKANNVLGFDLKSMCFNGPEEELSKTENTQPSILTTSIAIYSVLKSYGFRPYITAGLSLGEYGALIASEAMAFEDAVVLVKKRGKYMQEAVPLGVGTMAAVMGLDKEEIKEVIENSKDAGIVEPANYNCPGQIVIAGEVKAVEKACSIAKEKGAKRAMMLPVSAPFHCSMLKPAGQKLEIEIDKINIKELEIPVVSNATSELYPGKAEVKNLLVQQVYNPVRWEDCVKTMLEQGVDTFVEVGPGKALSAFIKKIDKEVNIINVEDLSSLNKALEVLGLKEV